MQSIQGCHEHLCNWVCVLLLSRNQRGKLDVSALTVRFCLRVCGTSSSALSRQLSLRWTNFPRWDWWRRWWGNVGQLRHVITQVKEDSYGVARNDKSSAARWPSAHRLAGDISAGLDTLHSVASSTGPHTHTHFYLALKTAQTQVHPYEQAYTYIFTCSNARVEGTTAMQFVFSTTSSSTQSGPITLSLVTALNFSRTPGPSWTVQSYY